jgi:hypothetical protein
MPAGGVPAIVAAAEQELHILHRRRRADGLYAKDKPAVRRRRLSVRQRGGGQDSSRRGHGQKEDAHNHILSVKISPMRLEPLDVIGSCVSRTQPECKDYTNRLSLEAHGRTPWICSADGLNASPPANSQQPTANSLRPTRPSAIERFIEAEKLR